MEKNLGDILTVLISLGFVLGAGWIGYSIGRTTGWEHNKGALREQFKEVIIDEVGMAMQLVEHKVDYGTIIDNLNKHGTLKEFWIEVEEEGSEDLIEIESWSRFKKFIIGEVDMAVQLVWQKVDVEVIFDNLHKYGSLEKLYNDNF